MKIEQFTHQYSLSKTLRFKLIPQGKTRDTFEKQHILETDFQRAEEYALMKNLIDRYHKAFIERVLSDFRFPEEKLSAYASLYYKSDKEKKEAETLQKMAEDFRGIISKAFSNDPVYKDLFKKELFTKLLPAFDARTEEEKTLTDHFKGFATYFTGFNENRKNMYTGDGKVTEIAYRIVDQNLPKFLDNARVGKRVMEALPETDKTELNRFFAEKFGWTLADIFEIRFFNRTLTQAGIDAYNQMIGGYSAEESRKTQGINEKINLFRQKNPAQSGLPMLKPLYKQILSDRSSLSYIPEQFPSDQALLDCVGEFCSALTEKMDRMQELLSGISAYDAAGVHVLTSRISELSQGALGTWQALQTGLERQYDVQSKAKDKTGEKYFEKRKSALSSRKSYSLAQLQEAAGLAAAEDAPAPQLSAYIADTAATLHRTADTAYAAAAPLLSAPYPEEKKLIADDVSIEQLKNLLDAVKDFQRFAEVFSGTGKEEYKDDLFYGTFSPLYDALDAITPLYNKVRNYATQKPYSQDKIKINFNCSSFLSGWSMKNWAANDGFFLSDGTAYYFAVLNRTLKKSEPDGLFTAADGSWTYFEYQMVKVDPKNFPRLFIRSKGDSFAPAVTQYDLPVTDILEIYDNGWFKTEEKRQNPERYAQSVQKMIDYYKLGVSRHESFREFDLSGLKDSSAYGSMDEFYRDLQKRCYRIIPRPFSRARLDAMVEAGDVCLFQIYCKDMSEHSKGTPNLHTLYFKTLFSGENLRNPTISLNGGAEMFYREASLCRENTAVHPAGVPIENKNPNNPKKTSVFAYDLVKNKRYTKPQFQLHIPITLNYAAEEIKAAELNRRVRQALRAGGGSYVIGIDRGERNLLYLCVIDKQGRIVEQRSLNSIVTEYNGISRKTDYHALLDKREKERDASRKSWKSIEPIRELKEGYISCVIHYICGLVEKYDAVVALEDLNNGFKSGRSKVEKQVYQKFEKMLIDKLNYMSDKKREKTSPGGILNAYQLTTKFESFQKMGKQNGYLFYIPAWLTSKIDPVTGFVDLLHPKYESAEKAADFISRMDRISWNPETGRFEFLIDLEKFPRTEAAFRKRWLLESFGTRIRTFRDPERNNGWNSEEIDLTNAFLEFITRYGIDLTQPDLRAQLLAAGKTQKMLYRELMGLLALLVQLRNSKSGTEIDYLLSPVRNSSGGFYDSRNYSGADAELPADADANGAYHIAHKAQWAIEKICRADEAETDKVSLAISKRDWLEYVQSENV